MVISEVTVFGQLPCGVSSADKVPYMVLRANASTTDSSIGTALCKINYELLHLWAALSITTSSFMIWQTSVEKTWIDTL